MACTSRCDEIDWTVELVRYSQVAGTCHELVPRGGVWIPEDRPSATPLAELTGQAALDVIELRLRRHEPCRPPGQANQGAAARFCV